MTEKFIELKNQLKDKLRRVNHYALAAAVLVIGSVSLLVIKGIEFEEQRQQELKANQFHFNRELSARLASATDELMRLVTSSEKNEDIFHNDVLLRRARNNQYNPSSDAEITKLILTSKGRFAAKDATGKVYNAKSFLLESFPLPSAPYHWSYNPNTGAATVLMPVRNEIFIVNVPFRWFQVTLQRGREALIVPSESRIEEKFDWAVAYLPEGATAAPQSAEAQGETNLLIATSDSMVFRQTSSKELLSSGLLEGPSRYINVESKLTQVSGLSVVSVSGSNLRLISRWSAQWTATDVVMNYMANIIIFITWVILFGLAATIYRMRFKKLTTDLQASLAQLNPSRDLQADPQRVQSLEDKFNDIFQSAVWLYKLASQRQQKYSELSLIVKSCTDAEKTFLVYVQSNLDFPNYSIRMGENKRWRLCLLRSPYLNNERAELVLAVSGDSALARIIMQLASNHLIEETSKGKSLSEIAQSFEEKISNQTLNLSAVWFNAPLLISEPSSVEIFAGANPPALSMLANNNGISFADSAGELAFEFTLPNVSEDKIQEESKPASSNGSIEISAPSQEPMSESKSTSNDSQGTPPLDEYES